MPDRDPLPNLTPTDTERARPPGDGLRANLLRAFPLSPKAGSHDARFQQALDALARQGAGAIPDDRTG